MLTLLAMSGLRGPLFYLTSAGGENKLTLPRNSSAPALLDLAGVTK